MSFSFKNTKFGENFDFLKEKSVTSFKNVISEFSIHFNNGTNGISYFDK